MLDIDGDLKIIACATVAEELFHLGLTEDQVKVLDFGLHINPEELREALQKEIDSYDGEGTILLGYGLCSNALVGIRSNTRRLVIPKVDDCIAIFLGSREEHKRMTCEEPGTYYLTKGWIEAADIPLKEYERLAEQYNEERAMRVVKMMLAHYTRVALINTGNYKIEEYRDLSRRMADLFGLRYEEIPGSNRLIEKLVNGDWDSEFIIAEPGQEFELSDFLE